MSSLVRNQRLGFADALTAGAVTLRTCQPGEVVLVKGVFFQNYATTPTVVLVLAAVPSAGFQIRLFEDEVTGPGQVSFLAEYALNPGDQLIGYTSAGSTLMYAWGAVLPGNLSPGLTTLPA